VIKNLLIPQLNYLGCILDPSKRVLDSIQASLDTFALQGQQVSRDRRYLDPENGGLGLFELKSFLDAQKCSWIKRTVHKPIDNWRFDLKNLAPDQNILHIRNIDVSAQNNPILYNLVCAYTNFADSFFLKDGNYKMSPIFMNPAFVRSGTDNGLLDIAFFTRNIYTRSEKEIRKLTFNDCFINGTFKDQANFRQMNIELTGTVWSRLRSAMIHAKKTLPNRPNQKNTTMALDTFIHSFKKGSKKFREIINFNPSLPQEREQLRTVLTLAAITDTQIPDYTELGKILGLWNRSFLPNDLREFLFKERNNSLPLNNRTAHFIANVDNRCLFCKIINNETRQKESFVHTFFDCPVTRNALNGFIALSRIQVRANDPSLKHLFWYGTGENGMDKDLFLLFELFRFCIWKVKIRKRIPRAVEITDLVRELLLTITKIKPGIREKMEKNIKCSLFLQALG
jgi:hypothetical protein